MNDPMLLTPDEQDIHKAQARYSQTKTVEMDARTRANAALAALRKAERATKLAAQACTELQQQALLAK